MSTHTISHQEVFLHREGLSLRPTITLDKMFIDDVNEISAWDTELMREEAHVLRQRALTALAEGDGERMLNLADEAQNLLEWMGLRVKWHGGYTIYY